jgi:hypothetical protein
LGGAPTSAACGALPDIPGLQKVTNFVLVGKYVTGRKSNEEVIAATDNVRLSLVDSAETRNWNRRPAIRDNPCDNGNNVPSGTTGVAKPKLVPAFGTYNLFRHGGVSLFLGNPTKTLAFSSKCGI